MTSIAVYHKTVPNKKNQEKMDILRFFAQGARTVGDTVIDVHDYNIRSAEVAVIQGWIAPHQTITPHGDLRTRTIRTQLQNSKYVIGVDSNLFLYANTDNPMHYLRYSFNGVFPSNGIYCDNVIDPSRWNKISKNLNVQLKDYRKNGNHILLCMQRTGGWSLGSIDSQEWVLDTISKIQKYSNRPIVIRPHPGDKETKRIIKSGSPTCKIKFDYGISLSQNESLVEDLKNCWAAVNHNSSPVVGAAIEGIPIFVTNAVNSQCKEIANTNFSQIETPSMPDRQSWVERISMFHWNFDELKSGECWTHMKQFIT